MKINKITVGYVIQTFDTETQKFTQQNFVAGDEVCYEDENGDNVDCDKVGMSADNYLPYEMVQPNAKVGIFISGGVLNAARSNISQNLEIELVDADNDPHLCERSWDRLQGELPFENY